MIAADLKVTQYQPGKIRCRITDHAHPKAGRSGVLEFTSRGIACLMIDGAPHAVRMESMKVLPELRDVE